MLIGVVSYYLRGKDIIEKLDFARKAGCEAVELSCIGHLRNRDTLSSEFLTRLKKSLQTFKKVHFHAYHHYTWGDPIFIAPHPLCRDIVFDEIGWAIEIGKKLNVEVITTHSGWLTYGKNPYERKVSVSKALKELDVMARRENIILGVENIDYFNDLRCFELLEELNLTNIGITLDTGHAYIDEPEGIVVHQLKGSPYLSYGTLGKFIERFGKKIVDIHIHDADGEKAHLALGTGIIDFKEIIYTLRKAGYNGVLNMETLVNTEELIAKNISYLRKQLEYQE